MSDPTFRLSIFEDVSATSLTEVKWDAVDLDWNITGTEAASKAELPLLCPMQFGNTPSGNGSLRRNSNVRAAYGVAGDYDGGALAPEEAIEKLNNAQIYGAVYTTPSHTPERPRWRVLCPYSEPRTHTDHSRMAARLNGALDGVLAPESFTLSQSYYYGSIEGATPVEVLFSEGEPIDTLDDLDLIAIGKPSHLGDVPIGVDAGPLTPGKPEATIAEIRRALDAIPNNFVDWNEWNRVGMAVFAASAGSDKGFDAFDEWSQRSSAYDEAETAGRWKAFRASPPAAIGFGSLAHWARQASPDYLPPVAASDTAYLDAIARDAERDRAERKSRTADQGPPPIWDCDAYGFNNKTKPGSGDHILLKTGRDFHMEKIDWIWPGWLARGKFHMLAGQKSAGKSTIIIDMAAAISSGSALPDGTIAPAADAMIWSGEDGIKDTILPRFVAAGGDLDHLYLIDGTIDGGKKRAFDPATDIPLLIEASRDIPNLGFVAIDPVVLALPTKLDSHKNTETRRGLQPLVDFAEERRIALIGVTHFSKGTSDRDPVERVTGSLAFGALPRVIWGASANEDGVQRRLVRIGSNIGPTGGGVEYTLYQAPLPDCDIAAQRIEWGRKLTGSPQELLDAKKQSAEASATEFLREQLSGGAKPQKDIKEAAEAYGHSWASVRRAQGKLNIRPRQEGRSWLWELPNVSTWAKAMST